MYKVSGFGIFGKFCLLEINDLVLGFHWSQLLLLEIIKQTGSNSTKVSIVTIDLSAYSIKKRQLKLIFQLNF